MASYLLEVDPRTLRVPPARPQGADPGKLQRQIARYARSAVGMPPPWVYRCADGELLIYNGVTRATRIAKLAPGTMIQVLVIGTMSARAGRLPTVGDLLPCPRRPVPNCSACWPM